MKDFFSYAWQIIEAGGKVVQEVAEMYLRILSKLFFYSILYLLGCGLLIVLGIYLESSVINGIAVSLGTIFVAIWGIVLIPVMLMYRYAPTEVRYVVDEVKNRLTALPSIALAFTAFFYVVPVWRNPSLIFISLIFLLACGIFYLKLEEEASRKVQFVLLVTTFIVLVFNFYYPDFGDNIQEFKEDVVTIVKKSNAVEKPTEVSVKTSKPPPTPKPVIAKAPKQKPPQPAAPPPPEAQPLPKEDIPEIYESPILMVMEPQNLSEYNSSYGRYSGLGRNQFGGFSTGLDGLGFGSNDAIYALESELKKAVFQWGKENDVRIKETTTTRRRSNFFRSRSRDQELPDADLYLSSTIGFRTQEVSRKQILGERIIGQIIDRVLPRSRSSWRSRSNRQNNYEEITISLEILVTAYIFDRDRIIQTTADSTGSIETKMRSYDIADTYSSSSQNNQLILNAIQIAVQDAVAKLKL